MYRTVKVLRKFYGRKAFAATSHQEECHDYLSRRFGVPTTETFVANGTLQLEWSDIPLKTAKEMLWVAHSGQNIDGTYDHDGDNYHVVLKIRPFPNGRRLRLDRTVIFANDWAVRKLVERIHRSGSLTLLPSLATALEKAGCADQEAIELAQRRDPAFLQLLFGAQ